MRHVRAKSLLNYKSEVMRRLTNNNPKLANALNELKLDWFRISNQDDEQENATLFIYEEIGGWWGTPADELVKELHGLSAKTIEVRINSPGGSVFDSIAIYNALIKHPANITTCVDSLAASGASIIAMAGDKCTMMRGSQMMIHDAIGLEWGNAKDMLAMAEFLDKQSDNIATVYADKAGGEAKDWRAKMLAETWLFADEAVELGLADEVYSREDVKDAEEDESEESEEEEKQEIPEEDDDEENPDEEELPEEMQDALELLMRTPHNVKGRYKYNGRSNAPQPSNSWDDVRSLFV